MDDGTNPLHRSHEARRVGAVAGQELGALRLECQACGEAPADGDHRLPDVDQLPDEIPTEEPRGPVTRTPSTSGPRIRPFVDERELSAITTALVSWT